MLAIASSPIGFAGASVMAPARATVVMSSGFRGPQREGWDEQVRNAGLANTRDTFGRKKKGAVDVNSLKGYTVGSRAPSASVNSGTRRMGGYIAEFDASGAIGVQAPLGFWDPLGFTDGIDEAEFQKLRVAELKHGRVSMLACLGYIVPYIVKLPGTIDLNGDTFADVPNGLSALSALPPLGIAQILILAGALELGPFKERTSNDGTFVSPGDYDFDPLDVLTKSAAASADENFVEVLARKQAIELANGRLAMMGAAGFIVGDLLNNGNPYIGSPFEVGSFTL